MLEIQNLQKNFGGIHALRGISFTVPENKVLGVIGVNGSGKSTALNCICGVYQPSGGTIQLNGSDITALRPDEVMRRGVGRSFQVPKVFNRMTLVENMLVPVLSDRQRSDAELRARAIDILTQVQLVDLRDNFAEELSGGQQKLLELARLMMFDPKLLLLDEPFAGVNPGLCLEIIGHIENLLRDGVTIILVSHDLTSIYRLSDSIIVLNEGEIISSGSAEDVKSDPHVIEAYLGA